MFIVIIICYCQGNLTILKKGSFFCEVCPDLCFLDFFFLALSTVIWVTGSFPWYSESSVRQGWCGTSFISMFHTVWEVPRWSVKTWALEAEVFVQHNSQLCYSPAVWSETSCWASLSLGSLVYREVRWHVLHELAHGRVRNSVGHAISIQWKPLAFHCSFSFFLPQSTLITTSLSA